MSNSDSFIKEVTDEVRRDRLFALLRRWGWLAALIVVGIVGAAAWFEYQRTQTRAAAEAFGDSLLAALDVADPSARVAAIDAIPAAGAERGIVLALLAAGEVAQGGEGAEAASARLRTAAGAPDVPRRYRDLALLRAEILDPSDPAAARLVLETLAEPGAPYAALAEEQLAMLEIRSGDLEAGLERLRALERSAAATAGLQQRASQLIVALEAGSRLAETAPEPPAVGVAAEPGAPDTAAETVPEVAPEAAPEDLPNAGAADAAGTDENAEAPVPAPDDTN